MDDACTQLKRARCTQEALYALRAEGLPEEYLEHFVKLVTLLMHQNPTFFTRLRPDDQFRLIAHLIRSLHVCGLTQLSLLEVP